MKLPFNKFALSLALALMAACYSCATKEQTAIDRPAEPTPLEAKQPEPTLAEPKPVEPVPAAPKEEPNDQPVVEKPAEEPVIVAEIGDYLITKQELEKKLIESLRSAKCQSCPDAGRIDAETVLKGMVAEKATIIDGRERNLLKGEPKFKEFVEGTLATLLFRDETEGKIKVTEAEINEKMKTSPNLDRTQAARAVERSKYRKAQDQLYERLFNKLHAEKLRYNFPKAARIHQRLLLRPTRERPGWWIKNAQVDEELSEEEKNIALAKFDGGQVTLYDWFRAVCAPAPPKRPKDLGTVEGVERLLDRAMTVPILAAEARLRGLDKDPRYLEPVRQREEQDLLYKVSTEVHERVKDPTKEEIDEYFNKHKEEFRGDDILKIDQIWCEDLETARKVKEQLSSGTNFESVKQQYSLRKKEAAYNTSAKAEGVFFEDLWKGEPNQILEPVMGFYPAGDRRRPDWQIRWRVVKILEKKPGKMREYGESVARDVKNKILRQRKEAALSEHRQQLLAKYPHTIYTKRIKDIDPFDIP